MIRVKILMWESSAKEGKNRHTEAETAGFLISTWLWQSEHCKLHTPIGILKLYNFKDIRVAYVMSVLPSKTIQKG
jgi:hypothetical protein